MQTTKINWSKALSWYVLDPSRTYAEVAQKFGLSERAVQERGRREEWQDIRKETVEKLRENIPLRLGETLTDIAVRHVNVGKMLQSKGIEAIEEKKFTPYNYRDARESIMNGVDLERKALGMDRPQIIGTMNQQNNFMFGSADDLAKSMQTEEVKEAVEEKQENTEEVQVKPEEQTQHEIDNVTTQ